MQSPYLGLAGVAALLGYSLYAGYQRRRGSWTPASWRRFGLLLALFMCISALSFRMAFGVDNGVYDGMSHFARRLYFITLMTSSLIGDFGTLGLILWFAHGRPERQLGPRTAHSASPHVPMRARQDRPLAGFGSSASPNKTLLARLSQYHEGLPSWLQPVVWGALLLPSMMIMRMGGVWGVPIITAVLVVKNGPVAVLWVLGAFVLVTAAGAAGGLTYSICSPLRHLRLPGVFLRCSAAVATYLFVVFLVIGAIAPEEGLSLTDHSARIALLICAFFFGGILTWMTQDATSAV